jgi:hypothetical protein
MAMISPRRRQEQDDDDVDMIAITVLLMRRRQEQRRRRRFWVRPWIAKRELFGTYHQLMAELERESRGDFKGYLRMEPAMFHEMLERLTGKLEKTKTNWRTPLGVGLKLAVVIRYLASGNSYRSLAYSFRVPHNTISKVVREVCAAIVDEYGPEVFSTPSTPDSWRVVADRFGSRWNFHHACGALDGKHIAIRCPGDSGSLYYNYKGFFSIILLALVDGDYKFLWADVGANGSASDCSVFNRSTLSTALIEDTLGLPPPEPLPNDNRDIPYFLVADDAFPLRTWMMKPFSQREMSTEEAVFNYRLSRARRIVENGFGILVHRWRCLLTTLQQQPETCQLIVKACLCMHNLMRVRYASLQNLDLDREDEMGNVIPGAWRHNQVLLEMERQGGNRAIREAKQQRVYLKWYYNSEAGSVPWQDAMVKIQ